MMFLKWTILALFTVIFMIVQTIFQPLIALFVKSDGNLPSCLKLFQPFDTLATGDENFWNNEMKCIQSNYLRCLFWGWRNPAWGIMGIMGFKKGEITDYTESAGQVDIGDGGNVFGSVKRTCTNDGKAYWNYKKVGKWNDTYGYMIEFGWSLCDVKSAPEGDIRRLCIDIRPRIKL